MKKRDDTSLFLEAQAGNIESRNKLIGIHRGLVHSAIKHLHGVYEDNYQTGILALCEAINKYDTTKGCEFSSLAYKIIKRMVRRSNKGNFEMKEIEDYHLADNDFERDIHNKIECEKLRKLAVDILTKEEKEVIIGFFFHYKSYKELSRELGISTKKIGRIAAQGVNRLAQSKQNEK